MKNLILRFIAPFFIVTVSSSVLAQLKRVPYKVSIIVDENTVYEENIRATPYILPDKTING